MNNKLTIRSAIVLGLGIPILLLMLVALAVGGDWLTLLYGSTCVWLWRGK